MLAAAIYSDCLLALGWYAPFRETSAFPIIYTSVLACLLACLLAC
jgi:hypothetical protein